jgi:hypothetical protein
MNLKNRTYLVKRVPGVSVGGLPIIGSNHDCIPVFNYDGGTGGIIVTTNEFPAGTCYALSASPFRPVGIRSMPATTRDLTINIGFRVFVFGLNDSSSAALSDSIIHCVSCLSFCDTVCRMAALGLVPAGGPTGGYRRHMQASALRPVHLGGSNEWSVEHDENV